MRLVTCKATGEKGTSDTFYKSPNGKYYKSKEVYENFMRDKKLLDDIHDFINKKILKTNRSANNGLTRKFINESGLKYEDILNLLNEHYYEINDYLSDKEELSPFSKISIAFKFISTHQTTNITYAGCYMIQNKDTGSVYIGESIDLFTRFQHHIADLYDNIHHCKRLQEAFNKTKNIRDFTIQPLYVLPVLSIDKKKEKEETLYLEAAFYLKYRYEKKELYNTVNPYTALKEGTAKYLTEGDINAIDVLKLLYEDKYKVFSIELKKLVQKNLKDYIHVDENLKSNQDTSSNNIAIVSQKDNTCSFTGFMKDLSSKNILPENYDYNKVRHKLAENGIIYFDKNNKTIATDLSLNNGWLILKSDTTTRNGERKRLYVISDDGKEKIIEIISKYNQNEFIKAS